MPNILKRFLNPNPVPYQFPAAAELEVENLVEPEPLQTGDGTETEPRAHTHSPPPKTPVDYARLQAEAILADARQQATEFLERARVDAAEELEQLREAARQDGYRSGYAEGMAGAMSELQAQREEQAVELGTAVTAFLDRATQAREALIDQAQSELRDLAVAVAEKVVRVSLKSSGEIIARMIQGATEKLKRKEWVHIYIAGCDAKGVAKVTPSLTLSLSALSDHVKIVPMADDESGTCIIETPDEIIDASASTQLGNIRDLLADVSSGQR